MQTQIMLPAYANAVLDALERAGYRGYLVGGSLRDMLRGVTPHDYDMTTNATPEEMMAVFQDFHVIPTGLKHGTLTVMSEGHAIEVTTHRVDGAYLDARRPEQVSFTRLLEEDLARRDFTVNAMAWSAQSGVVDLFEGQRDLQRCILRAVGDPETRFCEDALRILRAFRFASQLQFDIDPQTLRGAAATVQGLSKISVERIFAELCKLLEGPGVDKALAALLACGCGEYVFFDAVCGVKQTQVASLAPQAPLRLAALMPLLEEKQALALSRRLHAPNAFGEALCAYLTGAREALPQSAYEARRFTTRYWQYWQGVLALHALHGEDTAQAQCLCRQVSRDGTAVEVRRLAVNGRELQEQLGVLPHRTAVLLRRLQDLVWQEPTRNKRAVLLELAREICEKERDFCE